MKVKSVPNCEICTDPSYGKAKHRDEREMNLCLACFERTDEVEKWVETY